MHRPTVELYEREAETYRARRQASDAHLAGALAAAARGGMVLDAGCGPGIYLPYLGQQVVGLDAAAAMLRLARQSAAVPGFVQGDLFALPFRRASFSGVWARQSYLHLRRADLPLALADLHRALAGGAPVVLALLEGPGDGWEPPTDDLPGRFFAGWNERALCDVVEGAGFEAVEVSEDQHKLWVTATRARTIPDTVGPGMRALVCGLNPSLHAADAGVAYAGPGNRFWRAAVDAGLVGRVRDPIDAVRRGVGMTDLVKRATRRAGEVRRDEYRIGAERVRRLVAWLEPRVACFVGLAGYRATVDAHAMPGWQAEPFAGVATYVMPSTSGLNAAARYDDLVAHLAVVKAAARR